MSALVGSSVGTGTCPPIQPALAVPSRTAQVPARQVSGGQQTCMDQVPTHGRGGTAGRETVRGPLQQQRQAVPQVLRVPLPRMEGGVFGREIKQKGLGPAFEWVLGCSPEETRIQLEI